MKTRLHAVVCLLTGLSFAGAPPASAAQPPAHEHHEGHEGAGAEHDHGTVASELGAIDFPISCDAAAKVDFDRGLALLHSFGYELSRDAFRAAAAKDPQCAIAWWGVAMTYYTPLWAPPTAAELQAGREAAERATAIGGGSERERGLIAAIAAFYTDTETADHGTRARAYRDRLEAMVERSPGDSEARIFLALALLGTAAPSDSTLAQQRRAGEILNQELERQPRHPGIVHYVIHSFDYPGLADLALPAARAYAEIAPASPHAQHMPSHIFTRLGLWNESVRSNLDSEASANAISETRHPGTLSMDALHALDYLEYAYLQLGRVDDARAVLERATRSDKVLDPNFAGGYALAAIPARWALEREAWKEAAALAPPQAPMPWERFPYALASTHFARAVGAARLGDATAAASAVAEIAAIHAGLEAKPIAGPYDWTKQVESMRLSAAALTARAQGRNDEALALARQAADLQDRVGKHPVTPGEILPAREILADLLAEIGRPREALAEYEAELASQPGRLRSLRGAAASAERIGDVEKARELRAAIDRQLDAGTGG